VAEGEQASPGQAFLAGVAVFQTDVPSLLSSPDLGSEVFGPSTLLVRFSTSDELLEAARSLNGHLTATIHGTEEDLLQHQDLIAILREKAGRLIFNQFPTGVEVCPSMQHGGPYPASTDSRTFHPSAHKQFFASRVPSAFRDFRNPRFPTN
jgi:NADP-dependent aldehyde dehydrogenase